MDSEDSRSLDIDLNGRSDEDNETRVDISRNLPVQNGKKTEKIPRVVAAISPGRVLEDCFTKFGLNINLANRNRNYLQPKQLILKSGGTNVISNGVAGGAGNSIIKIVPASSASGISGSGQQFIKVLTSNGGMTAPKMVIASSTTTQTSSKPMQIVSQSGGRMVVRQVAMPATSTAPSKPITLKPVTTPVRLVAPVQSPPTPTVDLGLTTPTFPLSSGDVPEAKAETNSPKFDSKAVFKCPLCEYESNRSNNLTRHIKSMHTTMDVPEECCDQLFKTRHDLHEHNRQAHGNSQYKCTEPSCNGVTFERRALLKRHRQSVHLGNRPFQCPHCNYGTSHKSNLDRHVRGVHGMDSGQEFNDTVKFEDYYDDDDDMSESDPLDAGAMPTIIKREPDIVDAQPFAVIQTGDETQIIIKQEPTELP